MADRSSLGMIGYILCAVTAAIAMTAAVLVMDHVSGQFDDGGYLRVEASTVQPIPASLRMPATR